MTAFCLLEIYFMIAYRHCDGVELDGMKKIGAFFMVLSWQGKIPLLVLLLFGKHGERRTLVFLNINTWIDRTNKAIAL